jgi:hypothetical protein
MDGLVEAELLCLAAPPLTPAPTGWAAPPGTMNGFWHTGQRTDLPAALSGTCIDR